MLSIKKKLGGNYHDGSLGRFSKLTMDYGKQMEKPNREYKDSVFVDLLTSNEVNMIEVYNALDHASLS